MAKLTLTDLTSLTNEESAIAALNANFAAIVDAIELTYSRNGLATNTLSADLDMNGFRVTNSGAPRDDNDIARLTDMLDGVVGPEGPAGPPVSDGDKGDVVVSSSGTVWTIDPTLMTANSRTLNATSTDAAFRTELGLGEAAVLNVGTTAGTVSAGNDSRYTTYVGVAKNATGDFLLNESYLYHSSGSAHTWTIQPNATIAHPNQFQIIIDNAPSGGVLTITRGVGVNLYKNGSASSADASVAAGGTATMIQSATNEWKIIGPGVS